MLHLASPASFAAVGELQRAIAAEGSKSSSGNEEAPTLQIANGMFLQQGYPLEAPFAAGLEQNFGVVPEAVDFQSPAGTEAINAWVAEQTHGLIPVGEVAHAADFMVDEEGTLAAASTVGTTEPRSRTLYKHVVDFDADRPFLFFLRDERSGAVLFAGRLVTPQD